MNNLPVDVQNKLRSLKNLIKHAKKCGVGVPHATRFTKLIESAIGNRLLENYIVGSLVPLLEFGEVTKTGEIEGLIDLLEHFVKKQIKIYDLEKIERLLKQDEEKNKEQVAELEQMKILQKRRMVLEREIVRFLETWRNQLTEAIKKLFELSERLIEVEEKIKILEEEASGLKVKVKEVAKKNQESANVVHKIANSLEKRYDLKSSPMADELRELVILLVAIKGAVRIPEKDEEFGVVDTKRQEQLTKARELAERLRVPSMAHI